MSGGARQTEHVKIGARARVGRRVLGAQGFTMGVFGGAGLAWSMANPHFGASGAPVLFLRVTPLHCALLLAVGVLTVFASFGRSAAMFNLVAALGWGVVTAVCVAATSSHTPGPMGFDSGDTVLYAVLTAYNLALMVWFAFPRRATAEAEPPGRLHRPRSDALGSR